MDTEICTSCGRDALIYAKTGWCIDCSNESFDTNLIICDTCHQIKVADYPKRKTCSTCREHAVGSMRPCGVCDTGRRYRTHLMCPDCQKRYGYMLHERQLLSVATRHAKRYGWSEDKKRNYLRKKVRERVHDSHTANV